MSALARMLAELGDNDDDHIRNEGLPEAQIERLKEMAARIAAGNQFKTGDVVTMRKDAPLKGAGKPHVVIELCPDAPLHGGKEGNWTNGARFDVIVISVQGDNIVPHAVPFWALEAYSAEA